MFVNRQDCVLRDGTEAFRSKLSLTDLAKNSEVWTRIAEYYVDYKGWLPKEERSRRVKYAKERARYFKDEEIYFERINP